MSILLVVASILIPIFAMLDPGYFSDRPVRAVFALVLAPLMLVAGIERLRRVA